MLRILALPVALAAVLASSGCTSADVGAATAPAGPDASESGGASPGATASGGAGAEGGAPSASAGPDASDASSSDASGSNVPEALSSTTVPEGDPGVPGIPDQSGASIDDVLRLGAVASWSEQSRRIALSLPASSSCWAFAAEAVVESPTRIVVQVEQPQPCDPLDAARTYSIAVPAGIDASADLQLAIVGLEYEFTLTLPAR